MTKKKDIEKTAFQFFLQLEPGQGFLQIESINFAADSSIVVSFIPVQQILTIPHAKLLARVHWIKSEKRQDNLWREWVVPGKLWPLSTAMCEELTQRQYCVIAWCCYDNIDMIFQGGIASAAPERPACNVTTLASHVTTKVVKFYGSNLATVWDVETTILVILCAKTYWIQFHPSIYKEKPEQKINKGGRNKEVQVGLSTWSTAWMHKSINESMNDEFKSCSRKISFQLSQSHSSHVLIDWLVAEVAPYLSFIPPFIVFLFFFL